MSVISLPAGVLASCNFIRFEYIQSQDVLRTNGGVSQVTSYPDRRWFAQLQVNPQFDSSLRAWSLALDRLCDRTNVVAVGPPNYEGPSTGYSGSSPLVNGANQVGATLAIDGMSNSTAILLAGDFFSFDVTSPGGSTNRQLVKVSANVTTNGSGEASASLVSPIRQAPANNAAVNISTPTALFMLTTPRSTLEYQIGKYSTFIFELEERIFP